MDAPRLMHVPKHRMHIDFANSITLRRMKEHYYLIIVVDSIDFTLGSDQHNSL